jgi:NTP pyrophosphatase (non-canonical NTP hydrolase)
MEILSACCNEPLERSETKDNYNICPKCGRYCMANILSNEVIDIVKKQISLLEVVYPDALDPNKRREATNTTLLAMIGEMSELMEGYRALPWKPERNEEEYIREEIIDLLHYVLGLAITWGIRDYKTLEKEYLKKRQKNIGRGKIHETHSNDLK